MSLGSIPDDIRVPLVWIDIDNSQALDGASAQSRKILVMGHAVSSGSADALSLTRITSDSQADQLYGKGSMLAEMLKMLRRANTYTETWAMPVAAPEGAAAKATLTVLGTATEAGTVALLINGVSVQVSVSAGATKENIAKAIADAVTKKPATQVAAAVKDDATDTVELTVNWHGVTGNGADVRLNYYTGEAFPAGVKVIA
ncbi:phage tail protein, partial [Escherichia coli]